LIKDRKHKAFLKFISRIADTSALYGIGELKSFLEMAERDFPAFTPTIRTFITLAKKTSSDVPYASPKRIQNNISYYLDNRQNELNFNSQMHLFDLLRSKELFTSNNELANFAKRVLPSISNT